MGHIKSYLPSYVKSTYKRNTESVSRGLSHLQVTLADYSTGSWIKFDFTVILGMIVQV